MEHSKHKTKFLIISQGRSGSNLLRSLINSHPKVYCDVELFNPEILSKQFPVFKNLIKLFAYQFIKSNNTLYEDKIYGFKLFLYQLRFSGFLVRKLIKHNWKIIHIQRINVLKQVFSGQIEKETKNFIRINEKDLPNETYYIDCQEVVELIKVRKKNLLRENTLLKNCDHITIIYENDLKEESMWNETAKKVFHFLNIEPVVVSSEILITDLRHDSERIENFNEIIEYLNKNGLSNYVQDYFKYL